MQKHFIRAAVCALLLLVCAVSAYALQPWEIRWELKWSVANVKVSNQVCSAMEGMGADDTYVYTAKIPANAAYCNLTRTEIDTGKQTHLRFYPSLSAASPAPCTVCGHANDIGVVKTDGSTVLYVATVQKKTALVRLLVRGDGAYLTGYFNLLRADGKTSLAASSVRLIRQENGKLYFLVKNGLLFYSCILDETETGGTAEQPVPVICPRLFEIDTRSAQFYNSDGSTYRIDNLETWVNQGATLDRDSGVLYVPLYNGTNDNAIILYDASPYLSAQSLAAQTDSKAVLFPQNVSFRLQNPSLKQFEIESCDFRSAGGDLLLYFNNNASLITVEGIYATNYSKNSVALSPLVTDSTVVYTVKYRANGGKENTALDNWNRMNATRHLENVTTNLRPNTFLPPDDAHYFAGWNLYRSSDKSWLYQLPDGTTAWYKAAKAPSNAARVLLQDRAPVLNLTAQNGDTFAAWAQWEAYSYTLTFDPQGGVTQFDTKTVRSGEPFGVLPDVSRDGYTFDGWFLPDGSPVTPERVFDADADTTLTAHWTAQPETPDDPQPQNPFDLFSFFRRIIDWLRSLFAGLIPG